LFDGIVVSGEEKLVKPDPRIYRVLLNRYNLKADETLLIDDNAENIRAAKKMGFQTVHITSELNLEETLKKMKVL
jgi:2-haloacid dehalogenase